ncbi:MAG TPA: hypothetical protein VI757_02080, partial [Bacteroidia bacterium]|nr:hypothetical protein [Bacteroidia bacterium]
EQLRAITQSRISARVMLWLQIRMTVFVLKAVIVLELAMGLLLADIQKLTAIIQKDFSLPRPRFCPLQSHSGFARRKP